jgi:hypothetical protein
LLREKVKKKLDQMVCNGIIEITKTPSEWVSKMVIVEKPNKSLRICLHPQQLNESICKEYFAIPTIDDLKIKLANKMFYSVLDLKDSFWQIKLDETSKNICTFSTPFGCYSFKRLPFGLSVSSEIFQRLNNKYFGDINGLFIYIDDLLIYASDEKTHDAILNQVVDRARKINVKFNSEKFQYKLRKVKFFGFLLSENGVEIDNERIKAINEYETPKNKKKVQDFLGFGNYLRDFIEKLSELTQPLRNLLKKMFIMNGYQDMIRLLLN